MILFRPVGMHELELIFDAGCAAFPPRLPEQPIFNPVTNADYAVQIARDWNTKSSSFAGYVTRFEVIDDYIDQFERQIVGGSKHEEFWIPADELDEFNQHITGKVVVEVAFFGPLFKGYVPDKFGLKDKNIADQIIAMAATFEYSTFDFYSEIAANSKTFFLNYHYWLQHDFSDKGLDQLSKEETLRAIAEVWTQRFGEVKLI